MSEYKTLKEFYPTPASLIAKMIKGLDLRNFKSVLEPSAGKGDIADFVAMAKEYLDDYWRWSTHKDLYSSQDKINAIYDDVVENFSKQERHIGFTYKKYIECIEKEPVLQNVLKGKDYEVIDDDFLRFSGEKHYDLIIMNPPFSEGDKHLMKAIKIAEKTGGFICCLLNAETLKNPYSLQRQELVQLLKDYDASVEYVENAFNSEFSERKTDVEVAIVKLNIPSSFTGYSNILEELDDAEFEIEEPDESITALVKADNEMETIKSAVLMYKKEIAIGKKLIEEYLALKPYLTSCFETKDTPSYLKGSTLRLVNGKNDELDYNKYIEAVRYKYWHEMFHKPAFMGNLPSDVQNEYFDKLKEFAKKEFSVTNICKVKIEILKNTSKALEDRIVKMFETLSYKHSMGCEKNIHLYNGWKSNSAFKINEKVVVPYMNCYDDIFKRYRYGYEFARFLEDLEKCLDYLDAGETFSRISIEPQLDFYEGIQETKNMEFKYFTVNAYKKGTIHIKFTNLDVLKKLNIYGSLHKGWLPPSYGKKTYNDMNEEEKTVIDEFEGEASYNEVFENPDRFICCPENQLLLTN